MNKNLKENVIHGDFNLPFTTYHLGLKDNINQIQIHWHEEIEIVYIEKGIVEINIDLQNYIAKSDSIYFIKPLSLHSMKLYNNKENYFSSMVFNLSMLQSSLADGSVVKYLAPILNNQNDLPLCIDSNCIAYNEILQCILNIFKCFKEKNKAFELEIKSHLLFLFSLLYKYDLITEKTNKNISGKSPENIRKILNYIKENYSTPISIKEIAEISGFSEYHFMKFFKKHIGMTCVEYINLYRLEQAANLLTSTEKSIMDIALEVGFNNVSYFNKLFKNTYNLTPKKYRNNYK